MPDKKYHLEDRLLEFAAAIIRLTERLSPTRAGNHVGGQALRAGTSPLFNHGEAQAAESPRDFVHKMKVCLKELRDVHRALRLIALVPLITPPSEVEPLLAETDELIRIFAASIRTAEGNMVKEGPDEPYQAATTDHFDVHCSMFDVQSSTGVAIGDP
ncbi:MAG: four helix bundle protein [Kiritimatiellae bacterium]|nr:four helix bundle protein [Kiritimatiellia bacterium]